MRVHSLEHVGSYAFPTRPVKIDFDALPTVIAVIGPNGAGKTTLLDTIPGALWLTMPYKGGALVHSYTKNGYDIIVWTDPSSGIKYKSEIRVDPSNQKTTAQLWEVGGAQIAGPLAKDYRPEIIKRLGSLEFFLCTSYALQPNPADRRNNTESLLKAEKRDRREILAELLGLANWVKDAKYASTRAQTLADGISATRHKIEELEEQGRKSEGLITRQEELSKRLEASKLDEAAVVSAVIDAKVLLQEKDEALRPLLSARSEHDEQVTIKSKLEANIKDLETRRKNNYGLLTQREDTERAAADVERWREAIKVLDTRIQAAYREREEYSKQSQVRSDLVNRKTVLETRIQSHKKTRETNLRQASLLDTVPCHGEGPYGGCDFLKDARTAQESMPQIRMVEEGYQDELHDLVTELSFLGEVKEPPAPTELEREKERLQKNVDAQKGLADRLAKIQAAEGRIAELSPQISALTQDLLEVLAKISNASGRMGEATMLTNEIMALRRKISDLETAHGEVAKVIQATERELSSIEGQLLAIMEISAKLDEARSSIQATETDVMDWSFLQKFASPTGYPALLVEQALPELGRLSTELLRESYGSAVFSIEFISQREKKDGTAMIEDLDIRIRRGTDIMEPRDLSGGEAVLVVEAVALGVSLYNANRYGRRSEILLRDELSGPLDEATKPSYVRMLRRAAELGKYRHVLFITHDPPCWDLADARIEVRNGGVSIT